MADEWTFKELSASDTDEIYRIAQLEYAVFPDPWSEKEIKNTLQQDHTFCVAAKCCDIVLGYFICYFVLDECEVARIAVAEDARCRGIGQNLFENMIDICRRKGLEEFCWMSERATGQQFAFMKKIIFRWMGYAGIIMEERHRKMRSL